MNKAKIIVVTGIPGSGTTEFCANYEKLDTSRLRVKAYNLGDMLLNMVQGVPQKPPIFAENLLDLHPEFLKSLTDRVFDAVLAQVEKDQYEYDVLAVDTHFQFFWNGIFTNAYDGRYLARLNPDMFVTLIDKPSVIKKRQMATAQGRKQNHNLRDISLWTNVDFNAARAVASYLNKPHYILPGKQNPWTVQWLLYNAFLMYLQMPITGISSEANDRITQFKERIDLIFHRLTGIPFAPLIDPRTIDIEPDSELSPEEKFVIFQQTWYRDLNLYIPEASDLVACYPPETDLSKGVGDETTRGFETGKNAWVIYPEHKDHDNRNLSPFMYLSSGVLREEERFFEFFDGYMQERIKVLKRAL